MKKTSPTKLSEVKPNEGTDQTQKEGGSAQVSSKPKGADSAKEGWNKSRRTQQKSEATEVHEYILDDEGHKWIKPKKPEWCGYFGESLFLAIQVICIICYACFTKYGIGMSPDTPQDVDASGYDPHRDIVQNLYPFF